MIDPTDEPRHYKKKPVIIKAMLLKGNIDAVSDWIAQSGTKVRNDGKAIYITTLEGEMKADPGDYIIQGVKDEFYPCKPDIFEATYERAY